MATSIERIRTEQPVKNTVHNLIQTLSTKLDSAARYGLYQEDASADGMEDCADVFARLAERDRESINDLLECLKGHIDDA
jgi:rubrerythrin